MKEVLAHYMPRIQRSNVLERLDLEPGKYFVFSAHREENVDSAANLLELVETLNALAEGWGFPVIVSTHPRTRKRLDALNSARLDQRVRLVKPFGFSDYIKLQMEALCVLSDSGTITEEASLLNLPAVTIRDAHERPEGMDVGTLIMSGLKKDRVLDAVRVVTSQHHAGRRELPVVEDYAVDAVSKQVLRVVMSHVDYINRTVWSQVR
jgi:UDP-N-acetylglucosamine 2-epimerase